MHTPVLLNETMELLNLKPGNVAIDCTVGGGGHAAAIVEAVQPNGVVLGIDRDEEALARTKRNVSSSILKLVQGSFADLKEIAQENGIETSNGVLFDLGLSSSQLDESGRGFSYRGDEPLDMRFDSTQTLTAEEVVNEWNEYDLSDIFLKYGEERRAKKIAGGIARARQKERISTTGALREIVMNEAGGKEGNRSLARVFQALRIAVNDELSHVQKGLQEAADLLVPGGRMAVISFHSLEDRMVKQFFRGEPSLKVLTKKPVCPSDTEQQENPRSRSAKLRAAEKQQIT